MFSFNLLHSSVLRICVMISAAHFSDELGMQTDLMHIFISATRSGLFLEPLRGRMMVF